MRVTVRAQFCKIDRVLLGMQFGVLVQVLFLGVLVTVRAHFYKIGGRVQGGCCLGVQLGAVWGDAGAVLGCGVFARLMAACLGAWRFGCCWGCG